MGASTPMTPNYVGGGAMSPNPAGRPAPTPTSGHGSTKSTSNFDDLWSLGLGSSSAKPATPAAGGSKSMKDLEKEKAQAGIWNASQNRTHQSQGSFSGFGAFAGASGSGAAAGGSSAATSGGDDLLL